MKKILIPILMSIMFVSCSGPLDKVYKEDTLDADLTEINKKLNGEDAQTLAAWLVMSKIKNSDLTGKTYKEILKEAKTYKNEQEELAAKKKKEKEERLSKIKNAITFAVVDKNFDKRDFSLGKYDSYITFDIAITNKTDKEIKAMKGPLTFYDLFGEKLYEVNYTENDPIKPGDTYETVISLEYNEFMNSHETIREKDIKDLKFEYVPDKILFQDGSEI
jgi:hypothetical protein